jgi:hypothetical protein
MQIRRKVRELEASSSMKNHADTWVTRVIVLEWDDMGLSRSQGEWALHWLITQRARTCVRKSEMPPAQ